MKKNLNHMRVKRCLLLLLVAVQAAVGRMAHAHITAVPHPQSFATVEGSLYRQTSQGDLPARGVAVTLKHRIHRQPAPVYSDADGNYVLHRVPPGIYQLVIWNSTRDRPLRTLLIRVIDAPFSRVPPIKVP
jgi:hypothetical protein